MVSQFKKGIIISACYLVRAYGMPSVAANLLHEYGITKKIIMASAEYDKDVLLPLYKSESILRGDA